VGKPPALANIENALWTTILHVACGANTEETLDAFFTHWDTIGTNAACRQSVDWLGTMSACMS